MIDDGDDVAVAAITAAELRVGVQLAKGRRREKRERFVTAVLDAVSIEPYDLDVAEAHADLLVHVRRVGMPRGAHDLIIAATARAQERQVVSSDQRAFAELPGVSIAVLREALRTQGPAKSFKELLLEMPAGGEDQDFERPDDRGRPVDL